MIKMLSDAVQSELLDHPQPVRPGEELDLASLGTFLRSHFPDATGPLTIEQFPKGYSNLTYLIRVGDREMVLRRSPFGAKIKTAHDMGREFRILSHIERVYRKVPHPLAYCDNDSVLGAPFYLMERVEGVILRAQPPPGLALSPPLMRQLSVNFIENLVAIHDIDYVAAGLGDLGKPDGYVTRQIEGWTKRYRNARTDDVPEMERLAEWLNEHKPAVSGAALIHNDYKYDNLVLNPRNWSQIKACLDWEMATIGDPLMDLGSTLGYWVDPGDPGDWQNQSFGLTTLAGNLSREELVEHYVKHSDREVEDLVFYFAYGLFKIAVIVQQIYARYRQGLTSDTRFAPLIDLVRAASETACLAISKRRISRLTE